MDPKSAGGGSKPISTTGAAMLFIQVYLLGQLYLTKLLGEIFLWCKLKSGHSNICHFLLLRPKFI